MWRVSFLTLFSTIITANLRFSTSISDPSTPPSFKWTNQHYQNFHHNKFTRAFNTFTKLIHSSKTSEVQALTKKITLTSAAIGRNNSSKVNALDQFMKSIGIENLRVVEPNNLPHQFDRQHFIKNQIITSNYFTKRYKFLLSVTLSHEQILRQFLKSDSEHLLLMEDDIVLTQRLTLMEAQHALIHLLSMQIPSRTWDIAFPGFCYASPSRTKLQRGKPQLEPQQHDYPMIYSSPPPLCAHSIIFTRGAAQLIVDHLRPFYSAYDAMLIDLICKSGMVSVRTHFPIFDQGRNINQSSSIDFLDLYRDKDYFHTCLQQFSQTFHEETLHYFQ